MWNLSDDGFLTLQAAIPADQLIPGLCRHQNIVQLIYEMLFQRLRLVIYNTGRKGETIRKTH